MGKLQLFILFIFLLAWASPVLGAVESTGTDTAQQIQDILKNVGAAPVTYQVTQADLDIAETKMIDAYKAYSDEQFMAFDGQMQAYMSSYRQKIIIAVLGVNAFVAGFIFYYLNNQNRKMSYESAALRRQRGEEERQYVIQNMNFIRDKMINMESINSKIFDSYVIPMQKFMEAEQLKKEWEEKERQRQIEEYNRWQRENQGYDQGYQQQGFGGSVGGGSYGGFEVPQPGVEYDQAGLPVARRPEEGYEGNY